MDVNIKYDKDINIYVAQDPHLKVFSQGYTEESARANLEDAVRGFLFVAYKHGLLERLLREAEELGKDGTDK